VIPGNAPKKEPSAVPRSVGQVIALMSAQVGMRFFTSLVKTSTLSVRARFWTISATAKRPTATTVKPTPSSSSATPKEKRGSPEVTSVPTIPSIRPTTTIARDFTRSPCASTAENTSPISMREKYSAAPNSSAHLPTSGPKKATRRVEMIPAVNEAIAAAASAGPARPWRAIW
jgi:hypothetical protein